MATGSLFRTASQLTSDFFVSSNRMFPPVSGSLATFISSIYKSANPDENLNLTSKSGRKGGTTEGMSTGISSGLVTEGSVRNMGGWIGEGYYD